MERKFCGAVSLGTSASTHITAVKRDDGILRAIDIRDICRNCIYIEIVGEDAALQCYTCEFPNKIEVD